MKFRGNKKKSHVLIYCILFISILVLVGPLYAISYNTLKDQVLKDSQAAVNRGMSRLDMEIEVLQNIRLEMQNDTNFIRMKNLRSFEEVRQYIILKILLIILKLRQKHSCLLPMPIFFSEAITAWFQTNINMIIWNQYLMSIS